jgi:hypothetical protein
MSNVWSMLFGLACSVCEQDNPDLWEVGDKHRRVLICRSCALDHKITHHGENIRITERRTGIPARLLIKRRVLH